MLQKHIAFPKEVWILRHAESVDNVFCKQKMILPGLIDVIRDYAGINAAIKITRFFDLCLGRETRLPYRDKNIPLSEQGIASARRMGIRLFSQGLIPDIILCSNFLRTVQTAKLLYPEYALHMYVYSFLQERNAGRNFGYPLHYLQHLYPKEYRQYIDQGSYHFRAIKGENMLDVFRRVQEELLPTLHKHSNCERVLVVSHKRAIAAILSVLLNADIFYVLKHFDDLPNLAFFRFANQDDSWILNRNPFNRKLPKKMV